MVLFFHDFIAKILVKIDKNVSFIVLILKQLSSDGVTVNITGTTGVAAAWCFHIYLRDFCGCHVSWAGTQLNLPAKWPVVMPPRNNTIPNR